MRTPLTYYGGKQRVADRLVDLMPAHTAYLEPYAGGAAVLFAKPRAERETLNDLDGQVMRFWRALRDQPEALAAAVDATPYSRDEWLHSHEPADDDVEAARRLLVNVDQSFSRSRESWSIPCVTQREGGRVQRGRWQPGTWANLPDKIIRAATRLRGVALENADALDLIPRWDRPGILIYVDPPYTGQHRRRKKGYAHDDHADLWPDLTDMLGRVEHAAVILSGYPCPEADALGWRSLVLDVHRTVQSRAGGELPLAPETVWLNDRVPDPIPNLLEAPCPTSN